MHTYSMTVQGGNVLAQGRPVRQTLSSRAVHTGTSSRAGPSDPGNSAGVMQELIFS